MTEREALAALRGDDPALAAQAEAALWEMWCRSGDAAIDLLLRKGVELMERRERLSLGHARMLARHGHSARTHTASGVSVRAATVSTHIR